jgi:pantoate--beta-alanine ligase
MHEVSDREGLRTALAETRAAGGSIGLVPTMGALHAGHLRLVEAARAENDLVVMSIFVNPTQFAPGEDFERYPRPLEKDRAIAGRAGVDVLFVPAMSVMYPDGPRAQAIWVDPGQLEAQMEGAARPGHFRGVATVVAKLFNLVQPTRAYFGQKDFQQSAVIRRMVRDLAFDLEVRVVPTVREHDGLALSSRNAYLSPVEREQSIVLASALGLARESIADGERDAPAIVESMTGLVAREAPHAQLDYVRIADLDRLTPVDGTIDGDIVIALAVRFGDTRLIDSMTVHFVDGTPIFQ